MPAHPRFLICCAALALACVGPASAANAPAATLNPYGGLIVPHLDWSTQPPARLGEFQDDLKWMRAKVPKEGDPKADEMIMHYHIWVPPKLPEHRTLGLILAFHGSGGVPEHIAPWVHESVKVEGLADKYIVIGLKSSGKAWADVDEEPVLKTVDWLTSVYPIDRRRIFIVGHSNGSWMGFTMTSRHLELFAGDVRYAGYGDRLPDVKDAPEQSEFYLVHGDEDKDNDVGNSRKLRTILQQKHYRAVYRELDGHDHLNIVGVLPVRADFVRWIDARRHKQQPLAPDEEKFIRQYAAPKKAVELFASNPAWDELLRIAGPQGAAVLAKAFTSDSAAVRAAAATACTHAMFDQELTVPALVKLLQDKAPTVRLAALKALAVIADWHDDQAQLALARAAARPKAPADERGSAVAGLASAAALPLLGNFDDDVALFQGLLEALGDDDQSRRAAAFAPLHEVQKDGLGYDPAAAAVERKGPLLKWREWFFTRATTPEAKAASGPR